MNASKGGCIALIILSLTGSTLRDVSGSWWWCCIENEEYVEFELRSMLEIRLVD